MLVIKIPFIFDFISYCINIIINILDYVMNICEFFNIMPVYTNEYIVTLYCIMFISIYFIKHNFKRFIYMPIVGLIIILIQIYSPVMTIKNYEDNNLIIARQGKRILCCNDKYKNLKSLKNRLYISRICDKNKIININKSLKIINNNDTLIIRSSGKTPKNISYYYKKDYVDYDIIKFDKNNINTLYIFEKNEEFVILEGIV